MSNQNNETVSTVTEIPSIKLYSVKAITLANFFGGILAGGFLLAQNFKAVNQTNKATTTWIYTILLIVFLILSAFIPMADKIPSIVYSAAFTILTGTMARKYQGQFIDEHINLGGQYHSTGRVVLITVICLILLLSIALCIFFYLDSFQRN